jgi:hypothetical protein
LGLASTELEKVQHIGDALEMDKSGDTKTII